MKDKTLVILMLAFGLFVVGYLAGSYGHVVVLKNDGTVCAEVK